MSNSSVFVYAVRSKSILRRWLVHLEKENGRKCKRSDGDIEDESFPMAIAVR